MAADFVLSNLRLGDVCRRCFGLYECVAGMLPGSGAQDTFLKGNCEPIQRARGGGLASGDIDVWK